MIHKKTWDEFRSTGLLLIINQLLHVFGWAIVFEFDDATGEQKLKEVYPARVKFRGFDTNTTSKSYIQLSEYMHKHSKELLDEAKE